MVTTPREGEYMAYMVKFIEKNNSKYTDNQIRFSLQKQGYTRSAVDRAFRIYAEKKPKQEVKPKSEPKTEIIPIIEPEKKKGFFAWLFGK